MGNWRNHDFKGDMMVKDVTKFHKCYLGMGGDGNKLLFGVRGNSGLSLLNETLVCVDSAVFLYGYSGFCLDMFEYLRGTTPETKNHNSPPLSSVQILLIPACCLLCVL